MLDPSLLARDFHDVTMPLYPTVTGFPPTITPRSVGIFLWAVAWACLLLISFTGWGKLTSKLVRIGHLPASIACSLGIAVVIFCGGWLNLAHAIYSGVIFAIVAVGLILYAAFFHAHVPSEKGCGFWRNKAPWARVLMICVILILVLRVAATVRLADFDVNDDSGAYLVFPQQMLATHSFSAGPFSDRHVISGVGGGYLLQTFVIAATSISNIAMADRTFGLILLFIALWDLGITFGLSFEQIALLEFLVYLIPQQTANLTFVMLPIILLVSLLWLVYQTPQEEESHPWRYALLAGAIGGAAVALKSTFLPCVGMFCLIPYSVMNWRRKKLALGLPIIAGVGAILVVAAWMIHLKLTAGTYLYPLFGHGVDYSTYGIFRSFTIPRTTRTIIKLFLQAVPLIALALAAATFKQTRHILFCIAVLLAAAAGITAFNLAAGGDSIWRYGFPQFLSAVLIGSVVLMAVSNEETAPRRKWLALTLAIAPLVGCNFYYDLSGSPPQLFRQAIWEFSNYEPGLRASLGNQALSDTRLVRQYRAVEAALPKDAVVLEDVGSPYLLNFKTHKIFVMDWPGGASPAPGWPFGQEPAALAQYLRQNSVGYIVYDYRYTHWIDFKSCQVLERPQTYSTELYVLFWLSLLSQNQLDHVRNHYESLYDDGKIAVINLNHPVAGTAAEQPVWTLKTTKEDICSDVMARYRANPATTEAVQPSEQ